MSRNPLSGDERGGALRGPVLTLLSGGAAAFLIGYVAKLVLLRLYDPADFGLYEFVVAIVGILIPVASLRYEDAIVLPKSDQRAREVLGVALLVGAVTVTLTLLFIPLSDAVARAVGEPSVAPWLWTVPAILAAMRLSRIAELWLTRRSRFGVISASSVTQSGVMTAIRIALGLRSGGAGGLLAGFGIGHAAAAVLNGSIAARDLLRVPGHMTRAGMKRALVRYRRFPVYSAPATLVAALATRLPFLLLLFFFDREVLGRFGQAFNVLYVPLALVGAAVGQVFFVRAAEAAQRNELPVLAFRVHRRLVHMAFVPVVAVAVAGPDLFEVLFGIAWREAGSYATWISAWVLFTSVASPLTRIFDVLERQRTDLAMNVVMLVVVAAALLVGGTTGSVRSALLVVGVAGATTRLAQIVVALRLTGLGVGQIARPWLREGRFAAVGGAVIVAARLADLPLFTVGALAVVLLFYGVGAVRRDGLVPWRMP